MSRYRRLFRVFGGDGDAELDEEIETHLAMRAEELEGGGLSPEEARREAERRFGDVERARRDLAASRRAHRGRRRFREWVQSVWTDALLAGRRARRAPGYTAVVLLTFALGIGLTTTGFTVVDHVLIRSLPYPDPDRLVALRTADSTGSAIAYISTSTFVDWEERVGTLSELALFQEAEWPFADDDNAFNVRAAVVTPSFFDVLRAPMLRGRAFTPEDARSAVVVVSEGFWRGALGAPSLPVLIDVAGARREVIGVVGGGLEYPLGTEVYQAIEAQPYGGEAYNTVSYNGIGRLAPDRTLEQASAELDRVTRAVGENVPEAIYLHGADVIPLRDRVVGDSASYLWLLMAAVGVLLLVVCANVAGLGVAQADTRSSEVAVRRSLGAGRGRLIRQLLTEHGLLALAGGALGVVMAIWTTRLVSVRAAEFIPRAQEVQVDLRVLAFAVVISALAGVLAGLVPALRGTAGSLRDALGSGRGGTGGRNAPGMALVAVEVALALVLLTGGGLILRGFDRLLDRDLGFRVEDVVTAHAGVASHYARDEWPAFWEEVTSRIETIPGVATAGLVNTQPGRGGANGFIEVEGNTETRIGAAYRVVDDDYWAALDIPVLAGRTFDAREREGSTRTTVINRTMAERYWPGEDPVGKRVRAYSLEWTGDRETAPWLTVIGVVGDTRHYGFSDEPAPEMYVSWRQVPNDWHLAAMSVVVRGEPGMTEARLAAAVRDAFREQNSRMPVEVAPLEDIVSQLLARRRLVLAALSGLALLSLALAAIGLYGLLSFAVVRRRREVGIRSALGADPAGIVRLMLGRGLRVVGVGLAAGLVLAFWLTRILAAIPIDPGGETDLLAGVGPRDPIAFAAAALVLALVASAAAMIPAWRAARIDPAETLRN